MLLAASIGCGEDLETFCPSVASADEFAFLTPLRVNSGVNGRDNYRAVIQANFGSFKMQSRNESVVIASGNDCPTGTDAALVAVLTATGAGDSRVALESGDFRRTIDVHVESYTTAQYDLGEERYNNPANANQTDRVACNECHKDGAGGAPHSPLALAGNADDDLVTAATTSAYPGTCEDEDGVACDCEPSDTSCGSCSGDCSFNDGTILSLEAFSGGPGDHVFNLTADERIGIMAYMRALPPEGL